MAFLFAQVTATDIRDIKGPVNFPSKFGLILSICLAGLGAFLLFLLIRYLIKRLAEKNKLKLPPHELALRRLKELGDKNLAAAGRIKEFYIELSDIVRRYLEERFTLKAPEMTTEEFLKELRETDLLSREHKRLLKDFLTHCDMVKFARYGSSDSEISSSFESAERLIKETKEEKSE